MKCQRLQPEIAPADNVNFDLRPELKLNASTTGASVGLNVGAKIILGCELMTLTINTSSGISCVALLILANICIFVFSAVRFDTLCVNSAYSDSIVVPNGVSIILISVVIKVSDK